MAWIAAAAEYVGSFFATDAAAAGGAAAAGSGAAAGAGAAAGGAAAAGAGTAAAAGTAAGVAGDVALATVGTEAATAGVSAGTSAAIAAGASGATLGTIATTASEASAIAQGASALYTLASGPGRLNVPPSPNTGAKTDQSEAAAEQQALARRQVAGGLQSTTGTSGGQAGAVLNPSTMSNRSLLGG